MKAFMSNATRFIFTMLTSDSSSNESYECEKTMSPAKIPVSPQIQAPYPKKLYVYIPESSLRSNFNRKDKVSFSNSVMKSSRLMTIDCGYCNKKQLKVIQYESKEENKLGSTKTKTFAPEYYIHLLSECENFAKHKKFSVCLECSYAFVGVGMADRHKRSAHAKLDRQRSIERQSSTTSLPSAEPVQNPFFPLTQTSPVEHGYALVTNSAADPPKKGPEVEIKCESPTESPFARFKASVSTIPIPLPGPEVKPAIEHAPMDIQKMYDTLNIIKVNKQKELEKLNLLRKRRMEVIRTYDDMVKLAEKRRRRDEQKIDGEIMQTNKTIECFEKQLSQISAVFSDVQVKIQKVIKKQRIE